MQQIVNEPALIDTLTHSAYAEGWIDAYLYRHGIDAEPTERQLCDAMHAFERYLHRHHPPGHLGKI